MKILIVLPNLAGGGAERLAVDLAKYWLKTGHQVAFALFNADGVFLKNLPSQIKIFDLKAKSLKSSMWSLRNCFRAYSPDIIWANMWPITCISVLSWILSFFCGKLILTDHIHLSKEAKLNLKINYFYLKLTILLSYLFAYKCTAVSVGVSNDLKRIISPFSLKIEVINNCLSVQELQIELTQSLLPEVWLNFKGKRILTVGNLKKQKNHTLLIEAFARLSCRQDVLLAILGEGDLRVYLEDYIRQLGVSERVLLPGFVDEISSWYSSADLFVLSSDWEGFGNVLIEALSYGLPIVSTDCESGPREILDNGIYGHLVPVGNPDALCDAMFSSLNSIHDKTLLLNRSQDYSIEKISNEYINIFDEFKDNMQR